MIYQKFLCFPSVVLIYSALYFWERAIWSLGSAAEQEFKSQFAKHTINHLAPLKEQLVNGVRDQVVKSSETLNQPLFSRFCQGIQGLSTILPKYVFLLNQ